MMAVAMMIAVAGCKDDRENTTDFKGPGVETLDARNVTRVKALLCGLLNAPDQIALDFEFGFEISTEPVFTEASTSRVQPKYYDENHEFSYQLESLRPGTVYYYRAYMINQMIRYRGETKTFTTDDIKLNSGQVGKLTCYSAQITARVNAEDEVSSYGVYYSTSDNPVLEGCFIVGLEKDSDGVFSCQLKGLTGNTTYYYCTYAKVGETYQTGFVQSFTTLEDNVVETGFIDTETMTVKSRLSLGQGVYDSCQVGLCYSLKSEKPTIDDFCYTCDSIDSDSTYTITLTSIPYEMRIYYRAYVLIDNVAHYGQSEWFERSVDNINYNGHDFVNLGLSVMWATCNVGAEKPEDYGDYYAWGETETKSNYDWSTYKWCNGSLTKLTKYNSGSYTGSVIDSKTVLDAEDDVAHVKWGGNCRMPTKEEFSELQSNCTWTWTTQNGVKGYKVTCNKAGYTDHSIFLPAAGFRHDTDLEWPGTYGAYRSNSLYLGYNNRSDAANILKFPDQYMDSRSYMRSSGLSVRPVCP